MKVRFISSLAVTLLVFCGFAAGQDPSAVTRAEITTRKLSAATQPAKPPVTPEEVQKELGEVLTIIQQNYGGSKTLDYNDIFKSSFDGMLHTLDPHSNYFDAKESEEFSTEQNSRYYGIGATIGDLADAKGDVQATYIKATFDGAPANKAGLRYGDKILEVNGKSMLAKPFSEVRTFLIGPEGTTAKLVIERLGTGKRETIEIVRGAVPRPSIREAYMLRPGVGYLKMDGGFNRTTFAPEFVNGMRSLRAQGMRQLIIDLRDNGGGLVRQAISISNTFLSNGQRILTQKGRLEGVNEVYNAENPSPDRSPIVMLVNGGTASASEIFAGAMQDHDRALIVGERTFGKGLVTLPINLDYGSMLLLTIAKYETPAGRLIQRDYSNGELYNYYTEGGSFRNDEAIEKPRGPQSLTDTGRPVYSGGGITPDVAVKPNTITIERDRLQRKLANPVFAFALELVNGNVTGFETYKIDKPITFGHDLKETDYPIKEDLFTAFKKYAAEKYKISAAQTEGEKQFVQRMLRTELITASFGAETSYQVFNDYDNQILKAIELLPQAKQLSLDAMKVRAAATR